MARFKIVTTGPGNTDHSLEMETLRAIDAEIVEVSGSEDELAKAVVDISGRPYVVCSGEPEGFEYAMIGGHFTGSLVRHVM